MKVVMPATVSRPGVVPFSREPEPRPKADRSNDAATLLMPMLLSAGSDEPCDSKPARLDEVFHIDGDGVGANRVGGTPGGRGVRARGLLDGGGRARGRDRRAREPRRAPRGGGARAAGGLDRLATSTRCRGWPFRRCARGGRGARGGAAGGAIGRTLGVASSATRRRGVTGAAGVFATVRSRAFVELHVEQGRGSRERGSARCRHGHRGIARCSRTSRGRADHAGRRRWSASDALWRRPWSTCCAVAKGVAGIEGAVATVARARLAEVLRTWSRSACG